jgi:(2Fe-2S) ferredoxin
MAPTLYVCTNRRLGSAGSCAGGGSATLRAELLRLLAERGLNWAVEETGCLGHCVHGPNIKAAPGGPVLHGCDAARADAMIDRLLAEWRAAMEEPKS